MTLPSRCRVHTTKATKTTKTTKPKERLTTSPVTPAEAPRFHRPWSSTAAHHPTKGAMIFTGVWRDSEAMPTPMPVMAVNIGWQKGLTSPRRAKVPSSASVPPWSRARPR